MNHSSTDPGRQDGAAVRSVYDVVLGSWANIDHDAGVGGEHFFASDGTCDMPAATMKGREEISAGYARRQQGGSRVSRHLVTNLFVDVLSPDRARARYNIVLYASRGTCPAPLTEPQAVVDVTDDCVQTGKAWLIQHRRLTTVFLSDIHDSVMLEPGS